MKFSVQKDQKKRNLYLATEGRRVLLKSIVQNFNLNSNIRRKARMKLSELPKRSSAGQVQRRCVASGRKRFILRGFNLSRFLIRRYANEGFIPGIRKSSW